MPDRSNNPGNHDSTPDAGLTGPGEYTPAGEAQGRRDSFTADEIARAFEVDPRRVHDAMQGEFGLGPDASVDSRQAQHLAEVLLGDRPQDEQIAALMNLGAYTPRTDHEWGSGETPPSEESDRLEQRSLEPDEDRARVSTLGEHDHP